MPARKKSRHGGRAERKPAQASKGGLTHDDVMQASVRVDPDLRRRSQLLWEDRAPSTRGPKASLTPDDVVQAAMEIADDEIVEVVGGRRHGR